MVRPFHFDELTVEPTILECDLLLDRHVSRQSNFTWDKYEGGHTKFIARARLAKLVGVHKTYVCVDDSYRYQTIDVEDLRLNHYFTTTSGERTLPQEGHAPEYLQEVAQKVGLSAVFTFGCTCFFFCFVFADPSSLRYFKLFARKDISI